MNLFTKQLEKLGMILEFLFYSTGPLTKFSSNWQMDFRLISHNLGISMFCWGLKRKLFLPVNMGANFPNITNSVDNLYLKCNLLSDSIVSGKRSNVLYSFSTSTKTRSMPFEIQPYNYLWSKINTKTITEVTFWFVDDEDREVDLNDIDISLTVVIKTKNGN